MVVRFKLGDLVEDDPLVHDAVAVLLVLVLAVLVLTDVVLVVLVVLVMFTAWFWPLSFDFNVD